MVGRSDGKILLVTTPKTHLFEPALPCHVDEVLRRFEVSAAYCNDRRFELKPNFVAGTLEGSETGES